MKRNLRSDENAVSPVIAVILMVAITVVLAATVFILVSDIGKNTAKPAFNLGLQGDSANHKVTVSSASSSADWTQVQFQPDAAVRWVLNANSGAGSPAAAANSWSTVTATSTRIQAGDSMSVCAQTALIPSLTLTYRDTASNSVLASVQLTNVPVCT